jgi:agmatinase
MSEFATMLHAGPATFFGRSLVAADAGAVRASAARAAVLGVPWDEGNGGRNGANYGPRAVRDVSGWFLGYRFDDDVDLFAALGLVDCGDVPVVPSGSARTMDLIADYTGRILDGGALPVIVGGNHSLTIGASRAAAARCRRMAYVAIDAHLDTARDLGGERLTSASPTARAAELEQVASGKAAVIGLRGALNPRDQIEYARDLGVRTYSMRLIEERGLETVLDELLPELAGDVDGVYVTFDLDSIDASAVPGTGTPEPGGFTPREALIIARRLGALRPLVFDLVELAPVYDPSGVTARLACSIIVELLAAYLQAIAERAQDGVS